MFDSLKQIFQAKKKYNLEINVYGIYSCYDLIKFHFKVVKNVTLLLLHSLKRNKLAKQFQIFLEKKYCHYSKISEPAIHC